MDRPNLPGVDLPEGYDWVYFALMAMAAAMFGGLVLHYLRKLDPIGRALGLYEEATD